MIIRNLAFKIKMVVFIAGGLLAIYAALGFYGLPALLKSKLPEVILQATGRKSSVSEVRFDPFSLQFTMQGFELQETGGQPFVGFDTFFVDLNALQSIRQGALVIDKVSLNKPLFSVIRDKDGAFNFQNLSHQKNDAKPEGGKVFPVNIVQLSITDGKLDWTDAHFKNPEKETVYPINLMVENLAIQNDQQASLLLSLTLNSGGKLNWQGAIGLNPMTSSGHIRLDNVLLARIRALALQDFVQPDLQGYELFEADYRADYSDKKLNVIVSQGKFELRDFQLSVTAQDKALVKMHDFVVQGIGFNLEKHELTIASVSANDADFKAVLNAEGVFNYQALLPVANQETAPASGQEPVPALPQPSWNIRIDNIALDNFGFGFEDQGLKKPFTLSVKPISFKLTNFTTIESASLPFQLSAGFNEGGLIKLDGNAIISPLSAQIAVDVRDIALGNFQPYVDKFARLDIIDGSLAIGGNIQVAKSVQEKPQFKFTGNAGVSNLLTREQLKNQDLIKWENLTLNEINVDSLTNQYSAAKLIINKPYARVIIKKDKSVNFGDIVINDNSGKDKPKEAVQNTQAVASKPNFKLGKIEIIDGSSDFADRSLILPFAAQIKGLAGGASGISSEQNTTIKFDLKGNAYDLAPVDIKGELSPYLGDYDVNLQFIGMPMPLVSSYMVQFAGYTVEKGKMSLELNYKVAEKKLTASNKILIDQFELGDKVENPNAVSLPLKLAVALLKDSEGKIKIDVPITGSLEDPQFSISHIVVDALVNEIGKLISSPFRALASLINSEEDLSSISFTAGEATINKSEISKLDDLAKALKARPALNLEIKGAAYQELDWPALSDDALYDQLKRMKSEEVNKQGGRKIRAEYVVISDQDYRRLMEQLFVKNFPLLVEKSFLGSPRLVDPKAGDFYAVAKEKLSVIIKPEPQRLKDLANQRAQAIANYLVRTSGIANERIYILDAAIDPKREGNGIVSLLSLKTD